MAARRSCARLPLGPLVRQIPPLTTGGTEQQVSFSGGTPPATLAPPALFTEPRRVAPTPWSTSTPHQGSRPLSNCGRPATSRSGRALGTNPDRLFWTPTSWQRAAEAPGPQGFPPLRARPIATLVVWQRLRPKRMALPLPWASSSAQGRRLPGSTSCFRQATAQRPGPAAPLPGSGYHR